MRCGQWINKSALTGGLFAREKVVSLKVVCEMGVLGENDPRGMVAAELEKAEPEK